MDTTTAVDLAREATWITIILGAPLMIVSVVVGLLISIFQAVTQIQEQTISFVPKLLIMLVVMLITFPWSVQLLVEYSSNLIRSIPNTF